MEPHRATHRRVVARARNGDETAWEEIFDGFRDEFVSSASIPAPFRRSVDAGDVYQDACERAWSRFPQFRGGDLRAWMWRIFEGEINRAVARAREAITRVVFERIPAAGDTPSAEVAACEELEHIRRKVAALPDGERLVVSAFYLERQSLSELAGKLGISRVTARERLARGLRRLRTTLAPRVR